MFVDAHTSTSRASALTTAVGDPEATRVVYATVVALAVLGVFFIGLAIWVLRRTRPEPELLSPLETMATRRWRKLNPAAQRRLLDDSRPPGASPLVREASEPPVDSSFAVVAPVASFDDLSDGIDDLSDGIDDLSDGIADRADADRSDEVVEVDTGGTLDDTGENERAQAVREEEPEAEGAGDAESGTDIGESDSDSDSDADEACGEPDNAEACGEPDNAEACGEPDSDEACGEPDSDIDESDNDIDEACDGEATGVASPGGHSIDPLLSPQVASPDHQA